MSDIQFRIGTDTPLPRQHTCYLVVAQIGTGVLKATFRWRINQASFDEALFTVTESLRSWPVHSSAEILGLVDGGFQSTGPSPQTLVDLYVDAPGKVSTTHFYNTIIAHIRGSWGWSRTIKEEADIGEEVWFHEVTKADLDETGLFIVQWEELPK